MKTTKVGMFVLLSLSIVTVIAGTAAMSLITPVFAGGDHHDHGDKKCRNQREEHR